MKCTRYYLLFFLLLSISLRGLSQTGIPRIVINAQGHSAKIENLLFTPGGEQLISISEDKTIRVWNATTTEMMRKFESQIGDGWEGMLYASAITPDGKLLAVAGYPVSTEKENYIVIIDLEKGKQVSTAVGHTNVINSLEFANGGTLLVSGSDDGTVKVWKVSIGSTLALLSTMTIGAPVKSISVNQATLDVAVAAEGKSEIFVYGLAAIEKVAVRPPPRLWKKHKGPVNKVAYSQDGTLLASSSVGTEFFIWRADGSIATQVFSAA